MINFKYSFFYKFYLFLILSFNFILLYNNYYFKSKNQTNIPELDYYNNQALQLLSPSEKCYFTLFFYSEYSKKNDSLKIKKINLKKKNDFVTFYECDGVFNEYYQILVENGLIQSYYKYAKNNFFMCPMKRNYIFQNKNNIYDLDIYQKVYKHLNSFYAFHKNTLHREYTKMKKIFFDDFNYMPETYIYPEEKNLIYNKFNNYTLNLTDLWIVKPSNLYAGQGITILDSIEKIELNEFVITKYIINLDLINEKKYDLRLHVLISGLKPLRIYFYSEGFARIAAEKFNLDENFISNKFVHLTNIAINKNNKKYKKVHNINDKNANTYTILMYENYLKTHNIEWYDIRKKIKDIIIKSIISLYRILTEEIKKQNVSDNNFYTLLGYDILITNKFEPVLIEINDNPTMTIYTDFERQNKTNLFVDTLNLIGITPFSRKSGKPLFNEFIFKRDIDNNINNALCELERPRGDYELIFPTKENINIYKKYFIYNTEENIKFWHIINSQK